MRALELAVTADPAFGLAIADLSAIKGTSTQDPRSRQINWERHHIEVVRAASSGNSMRAADLLREHLATVGCDPLAARIAAHLRQPMQGITDRLPSCHPSAWPF
jgi:DNA-binding FadR family transcriptional regulator